MVGQVATLDEFHRDVGEVVLFAGVENGHDIGMIQPARGLRLAEEALFNLV